MTADSYLAALADSKARAKHAHTKGAINHKPVWVPSYSAQSKEDIAREQAKESLKAQSEVNSWAAVITGGLSLVSFAAAAFTGPAAPGFAAAGEILGIVSTEFAVGATLSGCIAYDWDGVCQGESWTFVGALFVSPLPVASSIFGVQTGAVWLIAEQSRDRR